MSSVARDRRPVRRVQRDGGVDVDARAWPYRLPAVAQLLREGLDLPAGVTFLVGPNGSGKSTLVEAVAAAAGLNPEGGTRNARHTTRATESPLHEAIELVRSPGAPRRAWFLRAETMHGHYTYLESLPSLRPSRLHELSHGESFLELISEHLDRPGFFLLDEPEAALSFDSCLALLSVLDRLARAGGQVLCATHSPLLTALPGALLLQLDDSGYAPAAWQDLELVRSWRRFLDEPASYLRHLLP